MRTAAFRDVLKVVTYLVGCFLLAALITPPFFEMGKGFAYQTLNNEAPDSLTWLATKAERAPFDTYFKRALLLTALVGLYPLCRSLRSSFNPGKLQNTTWSAYLDPESSQAVCYSLRKVRFGFLQATFGFVLASTVTLVLAWGLLETDWFHWRIEPNTGNVLKISGTAIRIATIVSIMEEALFRGALLGIFLRAFKPALAILLLSLLFAASHFLSPPDDWVITDPTDTWAGLELLRQTSLKFVQPDVLIHSFLPLLLIGIILGIARYRTFSLWLPIGLHAGWVFSAKVVNRMAKRSEDFSESYHFYVGNKITNGLLPSAGILVVGIILMVYLTLTQQKKDLSR